MANTHFELEKTVKYTVFDDTRKMERDVISKRQGRTDKIISFPVLLLKYVISRSNRMEVDRKA